MTTTETDELASLRAQLDDCANGHLTLEELHAKLKASDARLVEVERDAKAWQMYHETCIGPAQAIALRERADKWMRDAQTHREMRLAAESRASAAAGALHEIAEWILPPSGETWDDGRPMSYGAAFGSNGERDYFRNVARRALSGLPPLASETAGPGADGLAVELEELREAWCLNVCDAPSPDDERRPLHTSECRKAKAALAALATPAALVPKEEDK